MKLASAILPASALLILLAPGASFAQQKLTPEAAGKECRATNDAKTKAVMAKLKFAEGEKRIDATEKQNIDALLAGIKDAYNRGAKLPVMNKYCAREGQLLDELNAAINVATLSKPSLVMTCFGEFAYARTKFVEHVKEGVAAKKIDPTELAELQKLHQQMGEMEHKALANNSLTVNECFSLHAKVDEAQDRLRVAMTSDQTPYEWAKTTPDKALASGDLVQGKPLNICRLKMADGLPHPGTAWNGNCYVGFGGKTFKQPATELLVVHGKSAWTPVKDGKISDDAPAAVMVRGKPVHFCRAKGPDNARRPGKLWNNACYISYGDAELKTTQFDVLTVDD